MFRRLLIVMFVLALATPAFAQDTVTPSSGVSESTFVALIAAFAGIIIVALTVFAYLQGKSIKAIYDSIPAGGQTLIGMGLEFLLKQAVATESDLDDKALIELATALGYEIEVREDGRVILVAPR